MNQTTWFPILGRNPRAHGSGRSVVVSLWLPRLGEHDFKWKVAEALGLAYHHYGFRLHPKAMPVNVQVYGDRKLVERHAQLSTFVICELELVVKKTEQGREFILVNLYLTDPTRRVSHEFAIVGAPKERPSFVYTTDDMNGVGISVRPL